MTTCARCGRCSRRRRGRFSGRSIGRARSASSTSGSPRAEVPVGHGQTRRGWVVVACLGYSRAGAGVLVFSHADRGPARRDRRLPERLGGLPRDAGLGSPGRHPRPRRPPDARRSPRFCGQLRVGWRFCEPADPQAKGAVERLQGYAETNFEPGRVLRQRARLPGPARRLVCQGQRAHAQDAARAAGRPARRRARGDGAAAGGDARHGAALGDAGPARSLPARRHQRLLARPARWSAAASRSASTSATSPRSRLDTGELACRHARVFARHRTITALEHARALRDGRATPRRDARSRSGRWPATTR